MLRAQIVLDEATATRLRVMSQKGNVSMSEVVRRALGFYFDRQAPDTSWIGSLSPKRPVSHGLDDIRASVAAARKAKQK